MRVMCSLGMSDASCWFSVAQVWLRLRAGPMTQANRSARNRARCLVFAFLPIKTHRRSELALHERLWTSCLPCMARIHTTFRTCAIADEGEVDGAGGGGVGGSHSAEQLAVPCPAGNCACGRSRKDSSVGSSLITYMSLGVSTLAPAPAAQGGIKRPRRQPERRRRRRRVRGWTSCPQWLPRRRRRLSSRSGALCGA